MSQPPRTLHRHKLDDPSLAAIHNLQDDLQKVFDDPLDVELMEYPRIYYNRRLRDVGSFAITGLLVGMRPDIASDIPVLLRLHEQTKPDRPASLLLFHAIPETISMKRIVSLSEVLADTTMPDYLKTLRR